MLKCFKKRFEMKKKIIDLLSVGLIIGFAAGLFPSFSHIIANRYIHYKMFRLIVFAFQKFLNINILLFMPPTIAISLLCHISITRPDIIKYVIKTAFVLASLLLILNLWLIADNKINAQNRPNIIWFLIDALRADHVGCYGYGKDTTPFIDKFAAASIIFKNAISQESYTQASAPSYFTSTYSPIHNVLYDRPDIDILDSKFLTLAEILKNENYNTAAFVFNPHLKAKFNFGQGFALYDDNKNGFDSSLPKYEGFETARKIYEKTEQYLRKNKKRPLFLYLHYRDVHMPYAPPPPYHKLFIPPDITPIIDIIYKEKISSTRQNADLLISQYDGEIRYTNDYIEKTLKMMENYNINLNNSIIIITADHGEDFFDYHPEDLGGGSDHGRTLYMEQIRVPLIISLPVVGYAKTRTIDSFVELTDIVPTILEVLNIDYKKYGQFQGKSLIQLIKGTDFDHRTIYSGGNYDRAVVIEDGYKYYTYDNNIKHMKGNKYSIRPPKNYNYTFKEELYNIVTDPKETKNLINYEKDIALRLKEKLQELKESFLVKNKNKSVKLDNHTKEELMSLGYLQ